MRVPTREVPTSLAQVWPPRFLRKRCDCHNQQQRSFHHQKQQGKRNNKEMRNLKIAKGPVVRHLAVLILVFLAVLLQIPVWATLHSATYVIQWGDGVQEKPADPPPLSRTILSAGRDDFIEYMDEFLNRSSVLAGSTAEATLFLHDYIIWHRDMRQQFPGMDLLENPEAPTVWIIVEQEGNMGRGPTDRLHCLQQMIWTSWQAKAVLLMHWYSDRSPLEAFLVPHLLNFSLPIHPNKTSTFERLGQFLPDVGNRVHIKHVGCRLQFGQQFSQAWRAMFQPSIPVESAIVDAQKSLGLTPGQYDAIHCRFGHPAFRNKMGADETDHRNDFHNAYAVQDDPHVMGVALGSIYCIHRIAKEHNFLQSNSSSPQKVYFYGDSEKLVQTILQLARGDLPANGDTATSTFSKQWDDIRSTVQVVGRENAPVSHMLTNLKNLTMDAFYSTFVDLYLAADARCIALGVGRFGYMAAKLAGTRCWTRFFAPDPAVAKFWAMSPMGEIPTCNVPIQFAI